MKKVLSVLLCIVLVFSMVITTAAQGDVFLSSENMPTTIRPGDEIDIEIYFNGGEKDIDGVYLEITFDSTTFTVVDGEWVANYKSLIDNFAAEELTAFIVAKDVDAYNTMNGKIFVLSLKAADNANYGTSVVHIAPNVYYFDENDDQCAWTCDPIDISIDISCEHVNTVETLASPATCIEVGYTAGIFCNDCGKYISGHEEIAIDSNHHVGDVEIRDQRNSTCTEDGYTGDTYCMDCGNVIEAGTLIPASGHVWDDGVVVTPATHEETGVMLYTCSVCGGAKNTEIPTITDHEFSEWVYSDEETHTRSCACGETETANHIWDDGVVVTPATHTETGVMLYTCSVCGGTKNTEIPTITDHEFGEWVYSDEETHTRSCACGETEMAAHVWDDGVVITPSTHTETGDMLYTCSVCGGTKNTEIPTITDHEFGEWVYSNEEIHTRTCACGETETANHIWDDGVVVTPATHTETGDMLYTCSVCGGAKNTVIPTITEHEFGEWTCLDTEKHTRSCACGETETAAHVWDDGVVITPATHTETGIMTYTCSVCGGIQNTIIPTTTEHEFGEWVNFDEETHTRTCACGETETVAHVWDDGVVITPATHEETGVMLYHCSVCGGTKNTVIPTIAEHEFSEWVSFDEETHTRTCACGETETAAHVWDDGVVITPATHEEAGVMLYTCSVCGGTKNTVIPVITEYVIAFQSNGGTGSMTPIENVEAGQVITLPECTFTRNGYTFSHWSYDGTEYHPGDTFTVPESNVTFQAEWTKNAVPSDNHNPYSWFKNLMQKIKYFFFGKIFG